MTVNVGPLKYSICPQEYNMIVAWMRMLQWMWSYKIRKDDHIHQRVQVERIENKMRGHSSLEMVWSCPMSAYRCISMLVSSYSEWMCQIDIG